MIPSLAISILHAIAGFAIFYAQEARPKPAVMAVVKLNDAEKRVGDRNYHLLAVKLDPDVPLVNTNSSVVYWFVNGQYRDKLCLRPTSDEVPKGELSKGVLLYWVPFPDSGNLEILGISLDMPDTIGSDRLRKIIEERSVHEAYKSRPKDIPSINVIHMDEIPKAIDEAMSNQPKKQSTSNRSAAKK